MQRSMGDRQTALFFGSFNPIHVGHLIIANTILQRDDVDEVWLVVSPQNPLKVGCPLAADSHRLKMAELAVAGCEGIGVCDIEMHLPRPSYTVATMDALRRQYAERRFCIVMGGDNLAILDRWREYERLLDEYNIMVYPRPGYDERCALASHPSVQVVEVPMMDISSTYIRGQIAEGHDTRFLLTEPVAQYVAENHLYEARRGEQ